MEARPDHRSRGDPTTVTLYRQLITDSRCHDICLHGGVRDDQYLCCGESFDIFAADEQFEELPVRTRQGVDVSGETVQPGDE